MNKIILCCIIVLFFNSCSDKPQDRLLSPIEKINRTATELDKLIIYDNELKVGGMMFYASPDNQIVDFNYNDTDDNKCIRYYWSGGEVYDYNERKWQTKWCGFGLIVGKDWTEIDKTHNLAPYGFNKLKFKLRGGYLAENVKIKIIGPKDKYVEEITNLSPSWQEYGISINSNDLNDINIYIGIVFENESQQRSSGGEVFIDDIALVRE